mmetsp:Transcript_33872/g.64474  ORF Transcript_33872/g.64474 Transcript_33872/m.64474 type:complete len:105 (+) Transcript_33872:183-497(+)|eukprot:CAMPEP_0201600844 /NCGR_PEP_ID=MMETSP0492-20130828/1849_1 /ASSEMBLY_ACC=CAM_ASM_000837 /TAXON_ID=420259 /ORGANISM="Thalassiosira gravida, Strain GMp14c1" /LENGTH=104 /DNA_ID=CAMNT_0048063767 /DNA_START=23 /DNA_END=337 /DNA_ORIENTATION=+
MLSIIKCIVAFLLLAQTASAFVPVTAGPSLDAKKGKIAGIGGIEGPKPIAIGGVAAFKVKASPKAKAKAKAVAPKNKKNAKKVNNAKPAEKKSNNFFIKTPWSK